MIEKLEECPDCGEIKRWLYDAQMCAACGHGIPYARNHLYFTVYVYPGADCRDACKQMVRLANRLGIDVDAKLNGVTVIAKPNASPVKLAALWEHAMQSDSKHKFVCAQPEDMRP